MTLPIAPPLPVGMVMQQPPSVSDTDGMIFPQELRQAPPVPKLLVPTEVLPPGVTQHIPVAPTPTPLSIPMTPSPMEMMNEELLELDFAPMAPSPSVLPSPVDEVLVPLDESPGTQDPAKQQPILQRRVPSPLLLQNLGVESLQQHSDPEEETSNISSSMTQPVAYHSAQMGAGQSLQSTSGAIAVALSSPLPVPNSPDGIEQVGFRRKISTDDMSSNTTAHQDRNIVYINDTRQR